MKNLLICLLLLCLPLTAATQQQTTAAPSAPRAQFIVVYDGVVLAPSSSLIDPQQFAAETTTDTMSATWTSAGVTIQVVTPKKPDESSTAWAGRFKIQVDAAKQVFPPDTPGH